MTFLRHSTPPDILKAAIILLCALVVSGFSFQKILDLEQPDFTVFNVDQPTAKYALMSNDKCVGTLSSVLVRERTSVWTTDGVLRASIGGRNFDATISISGSFNPLGQMQNSSLKLSALGAIFNITTKGVTPIVANFSANLDSGTISREISLPGPVTLEGDSQHARLRYPQASGFQKNYTNLITNQIAPAFDLRAIIDNKQQRCQPGENQGRMDLTLLSTSLSSTLQPLDSMMGGLNVPQ